MQQKGVINLANEGIVFSLMISNYKLCLPLCAGLSLKHEAFTHAIHKETHRAYGAGKIIFLMVKW